jgi:aminoglycoside phosphotransferase (APT) family kinase protein
MHDPRPPITVVERPADHSAFTAWRRLGLTSADAARIEVLKESEKTTAYRLVGCGPAGADIVATRRATETTLVERTIYGDVLSRSGTPSLRLHGVIDEGDGTTWMFLDDAGEVMPDLRDPAHRALAAAWLGRVHVDLIGASFAEQLPDRATDDALQTLRSTRVALRTVQGDDRLDVDGLRSLDALVSRLDAVEGCWESVVGSVAGLPTTLVHGDYVAKNLRLRGAGVARSTVPFDWEMGGWGVPLRDLSLIDLGTYVDIARPFWGPRAPELDRLADIGRLLGLVVAVSWEVPGLQSGWLRRPLKRLAVYHERLGSVLVRLGMTAGTRLVRTADDDALGPDGLSEPAATDELLTRGLRSMEPRGVARVIDVLDREPNPYRSTFPSEIVRCAFDDGVERRVFVKRYTPGIHDGYGFWDGGPYEARIYDDILVGHDLGTPAYLGSWSDPRTGDTFLALEFIDGWRLNRSETSWMVEAARWLAGLHRDVTPTAIRHPAVRVYDRAFYRHWSGRALASVRSAEPDASWVDPLIRVFDEVMVPRLLDSEPVFIHGEPYPENMIVGGDRIRTVDWQSAAIGPGAIDLACLTEGPWSTEIVDACRDAYVRHRWPDATPTSFDEAVEAARLYWSMRWLGADSNATTTERQAGYIERLRSAAIRLGLVATAG